MENRISWRLHRVCTGNTIPYSRKLEDQALPNVKRISEAVELLVKQP